jgi:hypothetical protein
MGTIKRTKEELIEAIKRVLAELYKEEFTNRWIESRERPITKIMLENGLQSNYSCAFVEVLKEKEWLRTEDKGVNMKYYVDGTYIPDFTFLADKIYENFLERKKRFREFEGYKDGQGSDLRPKQIYERKTKAGKTVIKKREEIKLGDMAYLVRGNKIVEARVTGMDIDDFNKITYRMKFKINENWEYCSVDFVFRTLDGILYWLRNNISKYDNQ